MHVWNAQGDGPILRFRGTVPYDDMEVACSEVESGNFLPHEPAVFVAFNAGCLPDGNGCNPFANGQVASINNCSRDIKQLRIFGNKAGQTTSCFAIPLGDDDNTTWVLGSHWVDRNEPGGAGAPAKRLRNTLIHEFGHVLGIGHPRNALFEAVPSAAMKGAPKSCSQDSQCFNVHCEDGNCECVGGTCEYDGDGSRDYLQHWDRKCSGMHKTRNLTYFFNSWQYCNPIYGCNSHSEVASPYRVRDTDGIQTEWGTWGSGPVLINSTSTIRYGLLETLGSSQNVRYASAFTNGILDFNGSASWPAPYPFSMATIQQIREHPSSGNQFVVSDPTYERTDWSEWVPPVAMINSFDPFGNVQSETPLRRCFNSNCLTSQLKLERTPRNITTAWDPTTDNTVVAITSETGGVRLRAGFLPYSSFVLRSQSLAGSVVLGSGTWHVVEPPSGDYTNYRLTGHASAEVGVACSDFANINHPWNCVLAWADTGAPDGRIHYIRFKVVENGEERGIEFANFFGIRVIWEVPNTDTRTGASVAYFNDTFHVGWKTIWGSQYPYLNYSFLLDATDDRSWWGPSWYDEPNIVHAPTFVAENGKESALVWTRY